MAQQNEIIIQTDSSAMASCLAETLPRAPGTQCGSNQGANDQGVYISCDNTMNMRASNAEQRFSAVLFLYLKFTKGYRLQSAVHQLSFLGKQGICLCSTSARSSAG